MSENDTRQYLGNHAFFADMPAEYLDFLTACAAPATVRAGDTIFRQGEHADKFFIMRDGHAVVEVPALYGPALTIQNLGPDQLLGWSWLIAPYTWDFQAHADQDSELIAFDGARVLARCDEDPAFGYALLKRFTVLMSQRLSAARRRMMDQWVPSGFA